jgi:hypothetical protein
LLIVGIRSTIRPIAGGVAYLLNWEKVRQAFFAEQINGQERKINLGGNR